MQKGFFKIYFYGIILSSSIPMKFLFSHFGIPSAQFLFIREGFKAGASVDVQAQEYENLLEETKQSLNQSKETFHPFQNQNYEFLFDGGNAVLVSTFLAQKFGEPTHSWRKSEHPKTFFVLAFLTSQGVNVNSPRFLQGKMLSIKNGNITFGEKEKIMSLNTSSGKEVVSSPSKNNDDNTDTDSVHVVLNEEKNASQEKAESWQGNEKVCVYRENGAIQSFEVNGKVYTHADLWYLSKNQLYLLSEEKMYLIDEQNNHLWGCAVQEGVVYGFDEVVLQNDSIAAVRIGKKWSLISKYNEIPFSYTLHGKKYTQFDGITYMKNGDIFLELQGNQYTVLQQDQHQWQKKEKIF